LVSLVELSILCESGMDINFSKEDEILFLFGEGGSKALVFGEDEKIESLSKELNVPLQKLGNFNEKEFSIKTKNFKFEIAFDDLKDLIEKGLKKYME